MEYQKPALTFDEQLDLLVSRGLQVSNRQEALIYLRNVSYYRLSAYFLPFKQNEQFRNGATFESIINLYAFDRRLRLLILEAIEPIEIAIRTDLIYHLSHMYGAFGYLVPQNFSSRFNHVAWIQSLNIAVNDANELFIRHYRKKYSSSSALPLWMALEVISFGKLSRLFKGLKGSDQQAIAEYYGLNDRVLSSWLHALVYVRNLCAHHARIWDRTLTIKPLLPKKLNVGDDVNPAKIYLMICILQYLLTKLDPTTKWKTNLLALLKEDSSISLSRMGFVEGWENLPLWQGL